MKSYGLACLLLVGCAAPSHTPSVPKPGSGIAEYHELTSRARQAVSDTVDALEGIRRPPAGQTDPQLTRFDRALNQLELTSIKTRARAEAIIARGQSYFDEWHEQLAGATNEASARADYNRLYNHFTVIRQRSGEVREEFRPFMAGLRQFRAELDQPVAAEVSTRPSFDAIAPLTSSGRRVLKALESVSTALNDAKVELHAMLASKK